jgi:hypothetical protein
VVTSIHDRVKEFLKKSTAAGSIVTIVYIGPADQHGNWLFKHDEIITFTEVCTAWNEVRKHSQRLVLLLDAPNR